VVRRRLSIHADGPVLARLTIGFQQPVDVDVMGQIRERHVGGVPSEFRDPSSFRGHGIRSRRTWHVSLRRFVKWCPLPSTGSLGMVPPLRRYYEALRPPGSRLASLRYLRSAIPRSTRDSSPSGPGCRADGSSRSLLYRLLPVRSSSRGGQ